VGVADGDTITLLDNNRQQHRIRLAGIDAPEKAQPFGQRSKQHLSELAFGKQAKADCYKIDRYDRDVCTVYVDGKDIGLAQIDAGMAWWFRKYARMKAEPSDAAPAPRFSLWDLRPPATRAGLLHLCTGGRPAAMAAAASLHFGCPQVLLLTPSCWPVCGVMSYTMLSGRAGSPLTPPGT
jgi:hypothetical protein